MAPSATRAALAAAHADRDLAPAPVCAGATPAPGRVVLPPAAFAPTWKGRPAAPIPVGLRLVSETTNDRARAEATASADRHFAPPLQDVEGYVQHWNAAAMRGVLAHALCQADDADAPFFESLAEDLIGHAFVEYGIVRLWQGYCELRERLSPLLRLAGPDDISDLSTRLSHEGAIGLLPDGDRRLLARILDDLRSRAG